MMAWRPRASSSVLHTEGRHRLTTPDGFGPVRTLLTVADDGSRWRGPGETHGFDAVVKNGSATTRGAPLGLRHPTQASGRRAQSRQGRGPYGGADAPSLAAPARAGHSIE